LPVVLDEEGVISRAEVAIVDAATEKRNTGIAAQKICEAVEIDLTASEKVQRDRRLVMHGLDAGTRRVAAAHDRNNICKRCGMVCRYQVYVREAGAEC